MAVFHFTPGWNGPSRDTVLERMQAGEPQIFMHSLSDPDNLAVHPLNLTDDELEIVAERLKQELATRR